MARTRSANASRRRYAEFWNAFNRFLTIIIALTLLTTIAFWIYPELSKRNEMVADLEQKEKYRREQELLRKQREHEVRLLETNSEYLEIIARDKLDLMKEGETIFRLDAGKAAPDRAGKEP